jgi:hypothetical protein
MHTLAVPPANAWKAIVLSRSNPAASSEDVLTHGAIVLTVGHHLPTGGSMREVFNTDGHHLIISSRHCPEVFHLATRLWLAFLLVFVACCCVRVVAL